MRVVPPFLCALVEDDRGQDLVEYALLAVFVSMAAVIGLRVMEGGAVAVFNAMGNVLTSAV